MPRFASCKFGDCKGEVLARMGRVYSLMADVMYGEGLRLRDCGQLRVQDVDVERQRIIVRRSKGQKDRATFLPAACPGAMDQQLTWRRTIQRLPGHKDMRTTMVYTHVMAEGAKGGMGVRSPLDKMSREDLSTS